jgi:hypothetical protein
LDNDTAAAPPAQMPEWLTAQQAIGLVAFGRLMDDAEWSAATTLPDRKWRADLGALRQALEARASGKAWRPEWEPAFGAREYRARARALMRETGLSAGELLSSLDADMAWQAETNAKVLAACARLVQAARDEKLECQGRRGTLAGRRMAETHDLIPAKDFLRTSIVLQVDGWVTLDPRAPLAEWFKRREAELRPGAPPLDWGDVRFRAKDVLALLTPASVKVEDLPLWWPLEAAIAWLSFRNTVHVASALETTRAQTGRTSIGRTMVWAHEKATGSTVGPAPPKAEAEIVRVGALGRLRAKATPVDGRGQADLDASHWANVAIAEDPREFRTLSLSPVRTTGQAWRHVLIAREDLLREWPPFGGDAASTRTLEGVTSTDTPARREGSPVNLPEARKRAPRGLDYTKSDAPLLEEMRVLLSTGEASGPYDAALAVSGKAAGHGSIESKAKRLLGRYSALNRG